MAPRAYRLGKRAESVEQTRQRIIDAVVRLHSQQGIVATTYEDIARAADVAQATVYRHFPTLDELVPACGDRILEMTSPPGAEILEGKTTREERVAAFVSALFAFWGRSRVYIEKAVSEVDQVPVLARGLQAQALFIEQLARLAIGKAAEDGDALQVMLALTNFPVWKSLADRGLESNAADIVTEAVLSRIPRSRGKQEEHDNG